MLVETRAGRVSRVRGDPDCPVNRGKLCLLAATLPEALHRGRLLHPMVREDGGLCRASWSEALDTAAEKFREVIDRHGPDAVSFYASGQLLTEELYAVSKLARVMGTNNIDANSRLCMASAALGYKTSLGEDAPPACYDDIELAECILVAGSNAAECHPVLFRRIAESKERNPGLRVILVDPRRTRTAEIADIHLRLRPGSDVALFNAMLQVLVQEDLIDTGFIRRHTSGFETVLRELDAYTPEAAAHVTGLRPREIRMAALTYGRAGAALSMWSMGLNQSSAGVAKNHSIINLALATGNLGRPGAGAFSLTGQCNAMGLRMAGALSHLLPGHRLVAEEKHREEIARLWGIGLDELSPRPGLSAVDMFHALRKGKVRAVWICATNPAVSLPSLNLVDAALKRAELVVVQDAYHNETAEYAHVLLPAAQWPEKEGTMSSSERRVTLLRAITKPPGEAKPDLEILRMFAHRMGCARYLGFRDAEEAFREFRETTRGRVLDITGMSYSNLGDHGKQWPCTAPGPGTKRLYADRRFPAPGGRARFIFHPYTPPMEEADEAYPFLLVTGRERTQWHTRTRTGKIPALNRRGPRAEVNLSDARRLGIRDGDVVVVESRRGRVLVPASVDNRAPMGVVFLPFHYGSMGGGESAANLLTNPVYDEASKEPEYKACAVRLARAGVR
jgi:anaerobic selenocysteine-containing dehydrogenase